MLWIVHFFDSFHICNMLVSSAFMVLLKINGNLRMWCWWRDSGERGVIGVSKFQKNWLNLRMTCDVDKGTRGSGGDGSFEILEKLIGRKWEWEFEDSFHFNSRNRKLARKRLIFIQNLPIYFDYKNKFFEPNDRYC